MSVVGGWHPDPWQRAQLRYFDGQHWTEDVSTNGVTSTDAAALTMPTPPLVAPAPQFAPAAAPVNVIMQAAPKKRHVFRWIVLGVGIIVIGGIAAAAGGGKTKTPSPGSPTSIAGGSVTTVSKGLGTKDASGDVSELALAEPDAIGIRYVTAKVTNNSSKRSNYIVEVSIESADGKTQIDTTTVVVNNLEPGQSTDAKTPATTKDVPADATVTLKSVTRLAS